MFSTLYIEEALRDHPRVKDICARFPRATWIYCERYGEVFNPRAQVFRLQKERPALILAEKHGNFVLPTPPGYGIGGTRNFYFSHMLNCIYDCRYCFLQGMYQSAHLVLFVNYEAFSNAIEETLIAGEGEPHFFSGYDCDSLALDAVTGFGDFLLPLFARHPQALLELRTKSIQVKCLLDRPPLANCVVAFSFTPERASRALEPGVPPVERRIETLARLAELGWPIGLRFDPALAYAGYENDYRELFQRIFSSLRGTAIHSVSLGPFRLPAHMHKRLLRLYPEEKMLAHGLVETDRLVSYADPVGRPLLDFCEAELLRYIPRDRLFPCHA